MELTRTAALNGTDLNSVHSAIVIRGIETGAPKLTVQSVNRMGLWGQRITERHWESAECTVVFAIDLPKRQEALRREIFGDVCAWASACPGWLEVNSMANKRLRVDAVMLPESANLWQWTDEYRITFKAYNVPYWQDTEGASTDGTSLEVPGHMMTVAGCTVTNGTGSTINSLTVTAGDSTFVFASLGLADGEQLIIDHMEDGLVWIRIKGTNNVFRDAHAKRTGASSDDLFVMPGTRTVGASAGTAHFWAVGRWI